MLFFLDWGGGHNSGTRFRQCAFREQIAKKKKKKKNGNKKPDRTAGKPVPDVIAVVNAVGN